MAANWIGVPWMQSVYDCPKGSGVRKRTRSFSFLVLRKMRAPDADGCGCSTQCRIEHCNRLLKLPACNVLRDGADTLATDYEEFIGAKKHLVSGLLSHAPQGAKSLDNAARPFLSTAMGTQP